MAGRLSELARLTPAEVGRDQQPHAHAAALPIPNIGKSVRALLGFEKWLRLVMLDDEERKRRLCLLGAQYRLD